MESAKYVIIGAGLSGAAAAWRLAEQGHEVIVLERDVPASEAGSSHGSARIFRYPYQDQFTTHLVVEAKREWDELESITGKQLITPSGCLDTGEIRNPTHLDSILEIEGIERSLYSRAEAQELFPNFSFDSDVLWHPGAGVIDAENTVKSLLELAQNAGAQVLSQWEVVRVERASTGYQVISATGDRVSGEEIIVSAGGWLPALLGDLALPAGFLAQMPELEVRQENAFHFPYRDQEDCGDPGVGQRASWPTFIYKGTDIQTYGLPGGRDADFRGQKIAEYNGGKVIPSAKDQDGIVDPANRERVIEFVKRFIPGLVPEPYAETTCLFTNVPGDDLIIDRADGITIVSPCSGQGAKFTPLLGSIISDLVTGKQPVTKEFSARGQRF